MGSKEKKEEVGKLIRVEKPLIFLLQETKMREKEAIQDLQRIWKVGKGKAISSRDASGGLCTLWNTYVLKLVDCF